MPFKWFQKNLIFYQKWLLKPIVLDILLYNASQSHNPMVLHHLEGGTTGPGDRVLRFDSQEKD